MLRTQIHLVLHFLVVEPPNPAPFDGAENGERRFGVDGVVPRLTTPSAKTISSVYRFTAVIARRFSNQPCPTVITKFAIPAEMTFRTTF